MITHNYVIINTKYLKEENNMRKFKRIYIEITNVCNLSCSFCPKTTRLSKFMSKEEFEVILDKIKPSTEYIYFHLMGEPLLNPSLEEFLDLSYSKGFKVNLTTNGTLLTKSRDIIFKSNALRQINISLHSFEANNGINNFYEYFNNVLLFIDELNKNTNIICSMRLWNLDNSKDKGENSLNEEILNLIKEKFDYKEDIKAKLFSDKRIKLKKNLYLNGAEKFNWPDIKIDSLGEEGFCHGLRDHLGILSDGTVVPCCLDSEGNIPLGNILSEEFEDIINSKRAIDIYNGFSNRKRVEELCKRCGYSQTFDK